MLMQIHTVYCHACSFNLLQKNIEIVAKSVAKVSNKVVLVREHMVAIVGTMLRGFWRVRQALFRYNRFLEGTVQNLQFTI